MTLTLHWYYAPLLIAIVGLILGLYVGTRPEWGFMQFNPGIGMLIGMFSVVLAVAFVCGHYI